MADKAQAEPTMEEILASIRKIIADDSDTGSRTAAPRDTPEPAVSVSVEDDAEFDDLSLDDVLDDAGGAEALSEEADPEFNTISDDDDDLLTDVDEEMFDNLTAEQDSDTTADVEAPEDELEDFDFGAVDLDAEEPVFDDNLSAIEDEPEDEQEPEFVQETMKETRSDSHAAETNMLRGKTESTSAPASSASGITDDRIAGAAASALGKLMVKQSAEAGNPNTLEGLMMEMLRPMLKEWLDANLPAIVERKVEEEVQRIARMAR